MDSAISFFVGIYYHNIWKYAIVFFSEEVWLVEIWINFNSPALLIL